MSEYQYYEFLAVDSPLSKEQMGEVRRLSTRASITPTGFVNEYHWGNFKGKPWALMARYYDVFVYFANWGTRSLAFSLPGVEPELEEFLPYLVDDCVSLDEERGERPVLWLQSRKEVEGWPDPSELMGSVASLRDAIFSGDRRLLYLGLAQCGRR